MSVPTAIASLAMTETAIVEAALPRFAPKAVMTVPGTFSFDAPGDAARAAELRRVKALATLVLGIEKKLILFFKEKRK